MSSFLEKPSPQDIKQAAKNGKIAANYYGFTCDWCWRKGAKSGGWYDKRSLETNYIRAFTSKGAEIRLCLKCASVLKKPSIFKCCFA